MGIKREIRLTPSNIDKLLKEYQIKAEIYPKVFKEIMEILTEEMLQDVYPDTEIIPISQTGTKVISGIRNSEPKWTCHEYGTGVIGAQFPHVSEVLESAGWKYDINQHGEKGWWYPTNENDPNPYKWTSPEGQIYGWTKGLVAERCFYEALERAKERLPEIAEETLKKHRKRSG